ncbi:MAG: hypothetical protein LPK80_10815, partial [Bacteroidota bacterium]|nr:hypothetical protein [Bacteroidota bacterium]
TMVKIFGSIFSLPFTLSEYKKWAIHEIVNLSSMINDNDVLSDFWNIVETLLDQGEIREELHFKIDYRASLKIMVGNHNTETSHFSKPKSLLFLRLNNIHPIYASFKRRTGGHPIDLTSLTSYLKDRESFIGVSKGERFQDKTTGKSFTTSSFVFDLESLGIAIDRESTPPIATLEKSSEDPKIDFDQQDDDLPF